MHEDINFTLVLDVIVSIVCEKWVPIMRLILYNDVLKTLYITCAHKISFILEYALFTREISQLMIIS